MSDLMTSEIGRHTFLPDLSKPLHCAVCWQYEAWWQHEKRHESAMTSGKGSKDLRQSDNYDTPQTDRHFATNSLTSAAESDTTERIETPFGTFVTDERVAAGEIRLGVHDGPVLVENIGVAQPTASGVEEPCLNCGSIPCVPSCKHYEPEFDAQPEPASGLSEHWISHAADYLAARAEIQRLTAAFLNANAVIDDYETEVLQLKTDLSAGGHRESRKRGQGR